MPETLEAPPAAPVAPSPQPTRTNVQQVQQSAPEAFDALDALVKDNGIPDTRDNLPEARPRRADGTFDKKTDEKPDLRKETVKEPAKETPESVQEPDKETAKPSDSKTTGNQTDEDEEKLAPKALRQLAKARKAEIEKLRKEFEEAKRSKPADDPEKKSLAERAAAYEKRIKEQEETLRYTDYTKSDEYKDKYQKPFEDAWMTAQAKTASLKTIERKNELDEVVQASRQMTAKDFNDYMSIQDDDAAADWAEKMVGPTKAAILVTHRERVQQLNNSARAAVEDFRKNGSERMEAQRKQAEEYNKNLAAEIDTHYKGAAEKYPQWFKPDEADPKGNEILERDYHIAERIRHQGAPLKDGDKQWTQSEYAAHVAAARHKVAAFNRLAHKNTQLAQQLKEAQTKLEQYEASGPGKGDGKGQQTPGDVDADGFPETAEAAGKLLGKLAREA